MNMSQLSDEQAQKVRQRMMEMGVKFLPSQAIARIAAPSPAQKTLGATRRRKAAKEAARAQAAKSQAGAKK